MLTAQYIKQFGQYKGYCKLSGGYVYVVGRKRYVWNSKGIGRIY